jgi:hypothetical protein
MNPREAAIGKTLASGHASGLWTLEALDKPSPGWDEIEQDRVKSAVARDLRNPHDRRMVPALPYPDAGSYRKPRNLAREWIAAHPEEWEAMRTGAAEGPQEVFGTAESRNAAARQVQDYDNRKASGALAPTLDDGGLPTGSVTFPEVINGPVGFRPDWLGDVAKRRTGA